MGVNAKTGSVTTDRALLDVYRRLAALEKRDSGVVQNIVNNNTSVVNTISTPDSCVLVYNASTLATVTVRRWLSAGSGTLGTSLGASAFLPIPPGFTRATAISLAVGGAGSGSSAITFRLTLGTLTTEIDTGLFITIPATFSGIDSRTISIPITPNTAARVAVDKSAAPGSATTGVSCLITLEAE